MVFKTMRAIPFLLILALAAAALATDGPQPDPPLELAPGTTFDLGQYYRYKGLTIEDAQGQEFQIFGPSWNLKVPYTGEIETIRDHFRQLATGGGEILEEDGARGLHFRVDTADGPVYGKLHVGGSRYSLDLARPAPCPREVVFGSGVRAEARGKSGPIDPPLICDYPGSHFFAGKEHEFDRLELKLRKGRKTEKMVVEGHYWQKNVEVPPRADGAVHDQEIREAFRLAALDAGATILDTPDRSLVFHLPQPESGDLWCHLWPQSGKYGIKVVQEAPMEQVLVLEKDEMMARLEALGKLTLRGIFFDTAKATLKPTSEPALQQALDLMQSYPDLVLEIGGHTDDVGTSEDNQQLSENRAASVRAWLVEKGVAAERLQAVGYGEDRPIQTNSTEVGRAANRRVELTKISGGSSRDLVTLVTPYPGSHEVGEGHTLEGQPVRMYVEDEMGRPREVEVPGGALRRNFEVQDENGSLDRKLSGAQIRSNYRHAVRDLGGDILAERTHGLYFRLKDAAGQETWFTIWAPGPKYSITAVKKAR